LPVPETPSTRKFLLPILHGNQPSLKVRVGCGQELTGSLETG
jgi:hypothetical protein